MMVSREDPHHCESSIYCFILLCLISQPIDMLKRCVSPLPHTNNDIQLKWQTSEIPALAELLKALAT